MYLTKNSTGIFENFLPLLLLFRESVVMPSSDRKNNLVLRATIEKYPISDLGLR